MIFAFFIGFWLISRHLFPHLYHEETHETFVIAILPHDSLEIPNGSRNGWREKAANARGPPKIKAFRP